LDRYLVGLVNAAFVEVRQGRIQRFLHAVCAFGLLIKSHFLRLIVIVDHVLDYFHEELWVQGENLGIDIVEIGQVELDAIVLAELALILALIFGPRIILQKALLPIRLLLVLVIVVLQGQLLPAISRGLHSASTNAVLSGQFPVLNHNFEGVNDSLELLLVLRPLHLILCFILVLAWMLLLHIVEDLFVQSSCIFGL